MTKLPEDELTQLKEQYRKGTAEVLRYAATVKRLAIAGLFVIAAGAVVFTAQLFIAERVIERNGEAIEVGCTLLRNAIIQSGAANDPNAAPSDRQRLNAMLIAQILRSMPPADRADALKLSAKVETTGRVTIPDCHQIAKYPQTVKAVKAEAERKAEGSRSPAGTRGHPNP